MGQDIPKFESLEEYIKWKEMRTEELLKKKTFYDNRLIVYGVIALLITSVVAFYAGRYSSTKKVAVMTVVEGNAQKFKDNEGVVNMTNMTLENERARLQRAYDQAVSKARQHREEAARYDEEIRKAKQQTADMIREIQNGGR